MPDTLTPHRMDSATLRCVTDSVPWPCDYAKLLAHIDALTAAVRAALAEIASDRWGSADEIVTMYDDAVLTILRGES